MALKFVQTLTNYLAGSGTVIGATTIVLTSFSDIYGNALAMSDFGTKGYITLEPDTNNEEAATFTGLTVNGNGTVTLSGVKTALAKYPYTETSGLTLQHSGGSKVVVTDNVAFWNTFLNLNNDQILLGTLTLTSTKIPIFDADPTITDDKQVATKKYVDASVTAGAPDASTTTKGITKLDTAPASATAPIAVGSNSLVVAPLTGTSGGILGWTSTTVRASSVLLTNHALIVGGGAGATPTPLASLGTTTTLLHGNASGDPTFSAVSLTADVSGTLPIANGGTGNTTYLVYKSGTTTKNAADASASQTIAHGVGTTPKYVRIHAVSPQVNYTKQKGQYISDTTYNGTTQSSLSVYSASNASDGTATIDTTFSINSDATSTAAGSAGVVTFDATNITIAWTKTGNPSGTYTLLWEAYA